MPKKYYLKSRAGTNYISDNPNFIVNPRNPVKGMWTRHELDAIYASPQWDFFPKHFYEELVIDPIDVMYKPSKRAIKI